MGQGSCFIIVAILVLAAAESVLCQEDEKPDAISPKVYEIDYRGPETHSSFPPPERSRRSGPKHSRNRTAAKHSRNRTAGRDVRTTHG